MNIIKCSGDPLLHPEIKALIDLLRQGGLTASNGKSNLDIPEIVADILEKVAAGGDSAAAELTSELDKAHITPDVVRVPEAEIEKAHKAAEPEFLALMRKAIHNIREYQEHILIPQPKPLVKGGRKLGVRYTPLDRVGVYVPGGQALYPSTVLMTAVPAKVAGVREIVMASPPTGGTIHPMALALAKELGITEVYQLGGAVAMAAMAYGTETIRPVNKIVGPGNAFVAEAKRQLFGRVGIDSIAGPSEVLIVADDSAKADWVASDMLAQAEHNPGSAVLITPSETFAEKVAEEVDAQIKVLDRCDAIQNALDHYSAIIAVRDIDAACSLANVFAGEHVEIITRDNEACLKKIRHGGAIFVGPYTPVSLGDYYAGPSHVLPTGGTARFFGPLSCNDFRKASSMIEYDAAGLAQDADDVIDFATREGLTAHAATVKIRKG